MESGKNFVVEIVKASLIAAITIFLTIWINGSSELEYRDGSRAPYFNYPDAIKKDLEIRHKTTPIDNISVVDYAIHNRTFTDLEKVKIYVKIQDDKKYKLISKKLSPPKKTPGLDITSINTGSKNVFGFEVGVLKKTGDEYYYLNLIFEGREAPETEISIGNKNIDIVEYKKWKDNSLVILIVLAVYAVLLIPIGFWAHYSGKRSKNRFTNKFKEALSSAASDLTSNQVKFTVEKYEEVRDHKEDGWFKKKWAAFTATE
ncbi:hypothetical protein [Vibrio tasmaniensis]|uniref:hypothetical protein n=1 Tax=Vibrio tasmaniensis TaxID=212663 RepID=UPI00107FE244|nr:hypothetical protein [Vibrio tasmaniensis]